MDDAGKNAKFDQTFELVNIAEQVRARENLVLEAYDKDIASSDFIGAINGF